MHSASFSVGMTTDTRMQKDVLNVKCEFAGCCRLILALPGVKSHPASPQFKQLLVQFGIELA
jgi:hypothetical protein